MEKTVLISLPIEDLQTVIIDCVNSCLRYNTNNHGAVIDSEELLTVEAAAKYLDLSKTYVYRLISRGELPVMKRGARCYFSKAELFAYIKEGRKKTNSELSAEADQHIANKKSSRK